MPTLETYRKQAKRLVRWHEQRNHSLGERVRQVPRLRTLSDVEILAMPFPLALAQEVVAVEAGYESWSALRAGAAARSPAESSAGSTPRESAAPDAPAPPATCRSAVPILFVRDVRRAADWYGRLGFATDFLHGRPPFYGAVSRDAVCLHLRLVGRPNFAELARREPSLILATIEVSDVKALFDELTDREVDIAQRLVRQVWGGLDFHIRDPDGNVVSFVQYG